jgi:hypothetical protein
VKRSAVIFLMAVLMVTGYAEAGFKGYLRQSTTKTIRIGPFVDSSDGNTEEGGLTLSSTDFWLSKSDAAFANPSDTNAATVDGNVATHYSKQLNATDTNTLGALEIVLHESGALLVDDTYIVLSANEYDSRFGNGSASTDYRQVDPVQWNGTNVTTPDIAGCPVVTVSTSSGNALRTLLTGGTSALSTHTVNDVWQRVLINGDTHDFTAEEILRLVGAVAGGEISGAGTTTVIWYKLNDTGQTDPAITMTVDAAGNRSAVTLDPGDIGM